MPVPLELNLKATSTPPTAFHLQALHEVGLYYKTAPQPQFSDSDPHHRHKSTTGRIPPDQCDLASRLSRLVAVTEA